MIENYMETIVDDVLEEFFKKNPDIKKELDSQDILDIKMFSLNNLPAYYSNSQKGYAINKTKVMDIQSKINIMKAIVIAADKVVARKKYSNLKEK
jgi:hypothetical protein